MINEETFNATSLVCRMPEEKGAFIRLITSLPNAHRLRDEQGLGRLHASGWMEDALAFREKDDDEQS